MFKHFINLEWKSFFRAASFKTNLAFKIFMILGYLYFGAIMLSMGVLAYYGISKAGLNPLQTVNKFLVFYFIADLFIRYFLQKIPILTIRPLLTLPISKNNIVHFSLGKTALTYFNLSHALFFIPFSVTLLLNNYSVLGVITWHLGIFAIIYSINFLNILVNNKDAFFIATATLVLGSIAGLYFNFFDVTPYCQTFFQGLYTKSWLFLIPVLVLVGLYYYTFQYFKADLTLDERLHLKKADASTQNLTWLNQFGTLGTFLKNDIKLLLRNKRAKTTLYMSIFFLFYGLIFFTNKLYEGSVMYAFAAVFVTGGFMINFGQFVPSWDSSYYQFMMTQSISYKEYLNSKWWLMVIATAISTILASFYLYFGIKIYILIVAAGIYNIGFNCYFVLLTGAYTRTAIDLQSGKGAFGDKKAFNVKTLLFSIPQLVLPVLLLSLGKLFGSEYFGIALITLIGLFGLLFKTQLFKIIERIYIKEKYKAIAAYKEKN